LHGKREINTTTPAQEAEDSESSQPKREEQLKNPTSIEGASTTPFAPEEELEREREKSEDYLRRLQYLQADFENYRKRAEREMGDVKKYSNDRLLSDLLVILDELELEYRHRDRIRDVGQQRNGRPVPRAGACHDLPPERRALPH
jgi:molecular chaperone GrpE